MHGKVFSGVQSGFSRLHVNCAWIFASARYREEDWKTLAERLTAARSAAGEKKRQQLRGKPEEIALEHRKDFPLHVRGQAWKQSVCLVVFQPRSLTRPHSAGVNSVEGHGSGQRTCNRVASQLLCAL